MRRALDKLNETGVYSLQQWDVYGKKEQVIPLVGGMLNVSLSVAKNESPLLKGEVMMGVYESVFNATWNHVVEVPGDSEGIGMRVRKGKPSREWTDEEVEYFPPGTVYENEEGTSAEGMADPQEPRAELMVLNSEKGWPYTWLMAKTMCDCHIGRETERVWRIVKRDVDEWFACRGGNDAGPGKRLLVGTPGIGKSMGTGSYLLYQLLHYDEELLAVVAYVIKDYVFIFHKARGEEQGRVEYYKNLEGGVGAVVDLSLTVRGYIIYDVAKQGSEPHHALPPKGWGMIVVTSPNEDNFMGWEKQRRALRIIIDCPETSELNARCVWINRDKAEKQQQKEWKVVEERIEHIGPLPRYIFCSEIEYRGRVKAVGKALTCITPSNAELYFGVNKEGSWEGQDPCHKLVKITRYSAPGEPECYCNDPLAPAIGGKIRVRVGDAVDASAVLMSLLLPFDEMVPKIMEKFAVAAFLHEEFV
ncbi:retrotransposon hot spot (RHS) protein, partial [Trypanosoma grayi]|uniref:retrotransposon hot spot (RHS) protein n=1 Tax=Trypanosoma grayi TaxID=71804 RepID=UPI0004F4ABB3